jgi:hypothetical protein
MKKLKYKKIIGKIITILGSAALIASIIITASL